MRRTEALETICNGLNGNEAIVASTGLISRDLFRLKDSSQNFYMTGSLGLASSIALGIALNREDREVIVVEGDASLLMNLGTLATIGHFSPKNLVHIVLDNKSYASCNEEPSVSATTDLSEIARVSGYRRVSRVNRAEDLSSTLVNLSKNAGPIFILAEIELGGERDLPRPMNLPANAKRFKEFLNSKIVKDNKNSYKEEVEKSELIEMFKGVLKDISISNVADFSGIGLVLYDSNILSENSHANTRLTHPNLNKLSIGQQDCLNFLVELSRHSNPYHDGFVFINENGSLTHIAQYFVPSMVPGIKPNEEAGIRFHSAKYGSCLKGVIATGVVSRKQLAFYFVEGEHYLIK